MIVVLLNQTGGVGKTTLALHLTREWAPERTRVTLIDADPHLRHPDHEVVRKHFEHRMKEALSLLQGG